MPEPPARSPLLMSAGDTGLLVVDVQTKLIQLIRGWRRIVWNIRRLLDGAKILGVPAVGTEQYPRGLGPTVDELAQRLGPMPDKVEFSCRPCVGGFEQFHQRGIRKVLVVGIETHVCIGQTVMDLLSDGYQVYVAVDAVGARFDIDHRVALRRLESAGATLTTTEAALFEWCQQAGTPEFKQISALVQESAPEE